MPCRRTRRSFLAQAADVEAPFDEGAADDEREGLAVVEVTIGAETPPLRLTLESTSASELTSPTTRTATTARTIHRPFRLLEPGAGWYAGCTGPLPCAGRLK